jgi:hypothetical protein
LFLADDFAAVAVPVGAALFGRPLDPAATVRPRGQVESGFLAGRVEGVDPELFPVDERGGIGDSFQHDPREGRRPVDVPCSLEVDVEVPTSQQVDEVFAAAAGQVGGAADVWSVRGPVDDGVDAGDAVILPRRPRFFHRLAGLA